MSLEQAIYDKLAATAGVTALCGLRIFPDFVPQWTPKRTQDLGGPYPAIRYQEITGASGMHLTARNNLGNALVQVDCYASTPVVARILGRAVNAALHGFRGLVGSQFVNVCIERDVRSDYEPADDGSDAKVYKNSRDFEFYYKED